MKDGKKLLGELGELKPKAGLLPRPQSAHHRRRHARAEVGLHQRLHRGRRGNPVYDWTDRRPHLRHLSGARRAALRADRLHAEGAVDQAGAVSAPVERRDAIRRDLHRLGLSAEGLREVGGTRLPVGEALRGEIRHGGSGDLVLGNLERAEHRLLARHAGGVPQAPRPRDRRACAARCPTARVGGPDTAGSGGARRSFLEHCLRGTTTPPARPARRSISSPSTPRAHRRYVDGHVRMGIANQLRDIDEGFAIDRLVPGAEGHADRHRRVRSRGCAACQGPQLGYRNGTMYSSYTAASFARKHDLADKHGVNLEGALTWAFEFEDQPYFAGFRALATNGIDNAGAQCLPHVQRRWAASGSRCERRRRPARYDPRATACATARRLRARQPRRRTGSRLVWHYHDDDVPGPDAAVDLALAGLPAAARQATLTHYRIDETPQQRLTPPGRGWARRSRPRAEQYAELEAASTSRPPIRASVPRAPRTITLPSIFALPRQTFSLVMI